MYDMYLFSHEQFWFLSEDGKIRRDGRCFEFSEDVFLVNYCSNSTMQHWTYRKVDLEDCG